MNASSSARLSAISHDRSAVVAHSSMKRNGSRASSSRGGRRAEKQEEWERQWEQMTQQRGDDSSLEPYLDAAQRAALAGGSCGRSERDGADEELMRAYVASFGAGLDLEFKEEWAAIREHLEEWPRARLAAEGVALFGLSAEHEGQVYRDVMVKFSVPGEPLPFHTLSQVRERRPCSGKKERLKP